KGNGGRGGLMRRLRGCNGTAEDGEREFHDTHLRLLEGYRRSFLTANFRLWYKSSKRGKSMMRSLAAALLSATTTLLAARLPPVATFNKDVLPVLQTQCQECHRPGDIAPMPFLTYGQTRPWAKAIKQAVLTKKMPPWFAEPGHRALKNERRLTQKQIDTLVAW